MNKMKTMLVVCAVFVISTILVGCGCQKAKIYTVTFDSNGGTKITKQEVKENEKVNEPDDPTKEGYEFKGWYLDGKKYDFNKKVTKDIKLKAKWSKLVVENDEVDEVVTTPVNNLIVENTTNNFTQPVSTPVINKPIEKLDDAEVEVAIPVATKANDAVEFTISISANDYLGKKVAEILYVSDYEKVEKIELLDEKDNWNEYVATGDVFELSDMEITFRMTFKENGNYEIEYYLFDIETGDVVVEATHQIEVKDVLDNAVVSIDASDEAVVGEETLVNVNIEAKDYAGIKVSTIGTILNSSGNTDGIEKIEYQDAAGNWIELENLDLGFDGNFIFADRVDVFRVTFNTADTYEVVYKVVDAKDETVVLAQDTTTITTTEPEAETVQLEETAPVVSGPEVVE